jgi:hypothetical protein
MYELEERYEPVHEIGVQGGVLLRIYRLGHEPIDDEMMELWVRKTSAAPTTARILAWMKENPVEGREAWAVVQRLPDVGEEETVKRLRELIPQELHEGLEHVIWNLMKR